MKQTLGNIHPNSAQVLADLATLKARQKKPVEAQQLLRRSIAIWRHMGAGSNPALLTALKKMTKLCSIQGKCLSPEKVVLQNLRVQLVYFLTCATQYVIQLCQFHLTAIKKGLHAACQSVRLLMLLKQAWRFMTVNSID